MSNYPDDVHSYDHDPRSPFYESGPECEECGEEVDVDVDCDEDGCYSTYACCNINCIECEDYKGDEE